jgi:hypothetical protein
MEEMVFRRTSLKDLILAQPGPDSLNVWLANCYSELSPVVQLAASSAASGKGGSQRAASSQGMAASWFFCNRMPAYYGDLRTRT